MRALRAAIILAFAGHAAAAQGAYEIEVYSTEIAPVNSLLIELHSNYTFRGSEVSISGTRSLPIDNAWFRAGAGLGLDAQATPAACVSAPFFQRSSTPGAQRDALATSSCAGTQVVNSYATHESIEAVTGLSSWSEIGAYLFTNEQTSPLVRPVGGSLRVKPARLLRGTGRWVSPSRPNWSTTIRRSPPIRGVWSSVRSSIAPWGAGI
jgi:hypothetical protein